MLDGNISQKEHIKTVENKFSKNNGLLCKGKQLLGNESLKSMYFSYIYSYLNCTSIAWASTNSKKLKKNKKKKTLFTNTCNANNI